MAVGRAFFMPFKALSIAPFLQPCYARFYAWEKSAIQSEKRPLLSAGLCKTFVSSSKT